jgi:serine/threonine protein phosphatase PrpC
LGKDSEKLGKENE